MPTRLLILKDEDLELAKSVLEKNFIDYEEI